MRHLSAAQKKELTRLFHNGVTSTDNMVCKDYDRISNLNCYENLDSDIDRFLSDLYFEEQRSR